MKISPSLSRDLQLAASKVRRIKMNELLSPKYGFTYELIGNILKETRSTKKIARLLNVSLHSARYFKEVYEGNEHLLEKIPLDDSSIGSHPLNDSHPAKTVTIEVDVALRRA